MTSQPSAQDVMNLRKATGMAVLEAKRFLIEKDTELVKRILLAYELAPKDSSGFKMYLLVDHQEQDEVIGPIIRRVLDEEGKKGGERMGACNLIWYNTKKRLKEEFEINWYSPSELNPSCVFD